MADFVLPSLGADMAAATLVEWKIKPGDVVTRGQVVAEVETDKGIIDVECFDPGTVERLVAEPGQKLPVGSVMAVIRSAESATAPVSSQRAASAEQTIPVAAAATASAPAAGPVTGAATRSKATPAARRRAAELNVDPVQVVGSGPGGAVELADIERFASTRTSSASAVAADAGPDRMRRAIAAAMSKSKREIPHYYLATTIDMSRALTWIEAENQKRSIENRLLPAILLIKAVAVTLAELRGLNGFWVDDSFRRAEGVHVGLAIAMKGGGLVAPAVHDTDRKSLDELMAVLHELIPRARTGRLRSSEMTDATATLTNLGDLGVESVHGVIYPPQVALLGFGKIARRPWVDGDSICVKPLLTATLAADHRATDGRYGARFLETLDRRVQAPEQL
jgi:pyruvate dehydrogenase E2 component (dihydrolipoamide acetyltransferase)